MQDSAGPHFILDGARNGTRPEYQGTYGYSWSSSADTSATDAYVLYLYGTTSTVYPALNVYKYKGRTLRCLAKKGITTLKSPMPPNRWPFWRIPNTLQ